MARATRRNASRKRAESIRSVLGALAVAGAMAAAFGAYLYAVRSNPELDSKTMCPDDSQIASVTVLLVDVTDPMNLPQRQDFINQLHGLADQIPRHGKLVVTKVDPISNQLLNPVLVVCNPGNATDASEWDGNPRKLAQMHQAGFRDPLEQAFEELTTASGADRSPILESIQSVNLTEFQRREHIPRRLVIASDLLQHTDAISFYKAIPKADSFINSPAFNRTRTDMRGVEVELWMLEREDTRTSQPRALADLWGKLISSQNGSVTRLYRISG